MESLFQLLRLALLFLLSAVDVASCCLSDFARVLVAMAVPERGSGAQAPGGTRLDLGTCFARKTQQRSRPAMLHSLAWVPVQLPAV